MRDTVTVKSALKRGALVSAANWQVVVLQFVAETIFKAFLAVTLLGGGVLVSVLLGEDLSDFAGDDPWKVGTAIAQALASERLALLGFLSAVIMVVLGGSALTFFVKGGTVTVLVASDQAVPRFARSPLGVNTMERLALFSVARFTSGCKRLFRRYLALGTALLAIYGLSWAVYVGLVFSWYRMVVDTGDVLALTVAIALASTVLLGWMLVVNLLYLLVQVIIAVEDCSVGAALTRLVPFLRAAFRGIIGIFGTLLVVAVALTGLFVVATAGLGVIAFVPFAGLAAIPLQLAAWLLRGLVFQYLGLISLVAYLTLYRVRAGASGLTQDHQASSSRPASLGHTA